MTMRILAAKNPKNWVDEYVDFWGDKEDELSEHFVFDLTKGTNDHLSNKHRHVYFFPRHKLVKGSIVRLYTKIGTNDISGTKTVRYNNADRIPTDFPLIVLYMQKNGPIWNNTGDNVYLGKYTLVGKSLPIPPQT